MSKSLLLALCLLFAVDPGHLPGQSESTTFGKSPQVAVLRAQQLFRVGQIRAAEQLLQSGLADKSQPWNNAQLAGAFDLLAQINRDREQYEKALSFALRYQYLLDQIKDSDPSITAKRQEICLSLADIKQNLGRPKEAYELLQRALDMQGGARKADPLWELRVYLMQARIMASGPDKSASQAIWKEVEAQLRRWRQGPDRDSIKADLQSTATLLLAEVLMHLQQPEDAVAELDGLQNKWQQAKNPPSVQTLAEIAALYEQLHDYAREKSALQAALDAKERKESRKTTLEYAELLERLGGAQQQLHDDASAKHAWEEAANIYEEVSQQKVTDDQGRAEQVRCYQDLQRVLQRLERWQDAIRFTELLLEHRKQVLSPDDPNVWRTRTTLGALYGKVDDLAAAKGLLEQSRSYWQSRQPPAWSDLAGTLNKLSEVARNQGALGESLNCLEEAAPIYRHLYGADDLRVAELYANLAGMQSAKGQYNVAIENYREAVRICRLEWERADLRAGELLSTTLLNAAMAFKSQRQFREAANHCRQALNVRLKISDKDDQSTMPFYLALASLHLAQHQSKPIAARATSDDLAQATFYVGQAQRLCAKFDLQDKALGAAVNQLRGLIQLRSGELAAAQTSFETAQKIAALVRQPSLEAKCLTYLAEVELDKGTEAEGPSRLDAWQRASNLSSQALRLHDRLQTYPNLHFMAYLSLARAEHAMGHEDAALEAVRKAVQLIEAPRASTVGAESERADFFSQYGVAFDLLVDWSVQLNRLDDALGAAESGRNRTFLDQVRSAGIDVRESLRGTPQEGLLQQERDVLAVYSKLIKDLRQAYTDGAPDEDLNKLSSQIDALRRKYAALQTDIRDASPYYRNLLGKSSTSARWSDIAAGVLRPGNLLILYYLGHVHSHLFVIDGNTREIHQFPLEISKEQAAKFGVAPGALTRGMAARLTNPYLAVLRDRGLAKTRGVGPGIVASVKGEMDVSDNRIETLKPNQQIAFTEIVMPRNARETIAKLAPEYVFLVPDGALDQLPLEALLVRESPPRYLLDEFPPIAYAPSAQILEMLVARSTSSEQLPVSLLTVGDPHYPLSESRRTRNVTASTSAEYQALGGQLTSLPATLEECQHVKQAIEATSPSADVLMLTGDKATEGNIRNQIHHRRFVHLAAHGLVDQRFENQFGAIALTPAKLSASSDDDGFLSLYEIHNLSLTSCELVVLSACETKVGTDRPLEAGSTLARAFLAAGARDVVSSHWNVDDESTARLMSTFFGRLALDLKQQKPARFAKALHAARLELRGDRKYSAPYYWAPFVLVGPAQ